MVEFLSSVGFDFNESSEEAFFDDFVKMLEHYEKNNSQKITVNDKKYLVLNADNLEMLFPLDEEDNANVDKMDLFYKTDKWQNVTDAYWCDDIKDYIAVANAQYDLLSINMCVPNAYKIPLEEDKAYKMQTACFGQECEIYTKEEFKNAKPRSNTESFFNVGSYSNNATCYFNGIIKEVHLCKNAYSQNEFYHLVVECLGLQIDVLLNQKNLPANVKVGQIASVGGWLFGRFQNL